MTKLEPLKTFPWDVCADTPIRAICDTECSTVSHWPLHPSTRQAIADITIFYGGFKPPHIGHWDAACEALRRSRIVVIIIIPVTRHGITAEQSFTLWSRYVSTLNNEERRKLVFFKGTHSIDDFARWFRSFPSSLHVVLLRTEGRMRDTEIDSEGNATVSYLLEGMDDETRAARRDSVAIMPPRRNMSVSASILVSKLTQSAHNGDGVESCVPLLPHRIAATERRAILWWLQSKPC